MLQPGDLIDIWIVEAALGSGGMGSVYRCHNRAAKRILAAVKVLDGTLKRYPEAEARFIREADILGQVDHPNIVKVRNVRPDADPPYIEMEFVAGVSLDERLRQGPIPFSVALPLMIQCADALAYLHGMTICHRDIKPANLIVDGDRLKLVDFGLAVEERSTRITQQGVAFGTVSYAPPEWIVPDQLDPAKWDTYALGVVFYELLSGRLAFPVSGQGTARQQAMQVIVAKQGHAPLDPGDSFHDDVRDLIARMTHSNASARLSDAAEIARRTRALNPSIRRAIGVTLTPLHATPFDLTGPPTADPPTSDPGVPALAEPTVTPSESSEPSPYRAFAFAAGGFGIAGLAAAAVATGTIGLGAGAWWYVHQEEAPVLRSLRVGVSGAPSDSVDVVADAGSEPTFTDGVWTFGDLPFGAVHLSWVRGEGCTVAGCAAVAARPLGAESPGDACPSWCIRGDAVVAIPEGEGPISHTIDASLPAREVLVSVTGVPADMALAGGLGEVAGRRTADGLAFDAAPGRAGLWVSAGACPPDALGCGETCPPGCASVKVDAIVPAQGPVEPATVALTVPVVAPKVTTAPRPAPTPRRRGFVRNSDLAAFFAAEPEWAPGGAYAGVGKYLPGWTEGNPPAGKEGDNPLGISPELALAYCKHHGGLEVNDGMPWSEDDARLALRQEGEKLVLVNASGAREADVSDRRNSLRAVVFRCAQ